MRTPSGAKLIQAVTPALVALMGEVTSIAATIDLREGAPELLREG